jgi:hypothetical protein
MARAFREGGNPDVTVRVFDELNHLFLVDPSGNPASYATLENSSVSPDVLGALADWLATRLAR